MKKEIGIFRKLKRLFKKEKNNYDKSESVWSKISRQIDELEDKVREIECLEQKELAKQYSDRINNLREKYREKAISEETSSNGFHRFTFVIRIIPIPFVVSFFFRTFAPQKVD